LFKLDLFRSSQFSEHDWWKNSCYTLWNGLSGTYREQWLNCLQAEKNIS